MSKKSKKNAATGAAKYVKFVGKDSSKFPTTVTLHFDVVRVMERFAYLSRFNKTDFYGKPVEVQIPAIHLTTPDRTPLKRNKIYTDCEVSIGSKSIGSVEFFTRRTYHG